MAETRIQCQKPKDHARFVFLGSPLLDITSACDTATLDAFCLKPDDCVRATGEHDALFLQLLASPDSRLDCGGSALNSAKIAKWALGERGSVSFAGCVGIDSFASELSKSLADNGVEPLLVPLPGQQTGVCACLLSGKGERSMITRHGAAALFSPELLQTPEIREKLRAADCIFVVGYFVAHSPEVVEALAKDVCSSTQVFCLSLSAEYICRDFSDILLDILPKVDILVGNRAEVKALAKALGFQESATIEDCIRAMAKLRSSDSKSRTVVVTQGHEPVIVVRGDEPTRHFFVQQNVHVVDSVGCGDALAGALLGIYVLTGDIDTAVRAGIQAAVRIAQSPGCEPPLEQLCV